IVYLVSWSTQIVQAKFPASRTPSLLQIFTTSLKHSAMAGYSGTPLLQKLGIKPGLTVVTINAPSNYRRLLGKPASKTKFSDRVSDGSDFVQFFSMHRSELRKRLPIFGAKIANTGTMRVAWPKQASGICT